MALKLTEHLPLPSGYVDANGVVQLIPREFWHGTRGHDLDTIVDRDSCLRGKHRRRLQRLLKVPLPRKVQVVVSEQHLEALMRKRDAELNADELG